MTLETLTPNLMVEDVAATLAWYGEYLDFVTAMTVPDQPPYNWAMAASGGAALMFQSRASYTEEAPWVAGQATGGSLGFYIKVTDVEGWYQRLRGKVTVVKEPYTTFYGAREFVIRDGNGYHLCLAQHTD